MSVRLRAVSRAFLVMGSLVWNGIHPTPGVSQEPIGVLAGDVREATATEGIAGVFLVTLNAEDRVIGRGMSGSGGHFVIELPEGGPYRLRAHSMGVRDVVSDTFHITSGDTLWMPTLELIPDASPGVGSREAGPDQDTRRDSTRSRTSWAVGSNSPIHRWAITPS